MVREAVRAGADWFISDFVVLANALKRHQVAFIGSGSPLYLLLSAQGKACRCSDGPGQSGFVPCRRMGVCSSKAGGEELQAIRSQSWWRV